MCYHILRAPVIRLWGAYSLRRSACDPNTADCLFRHCSITVCFCQALYVKFWKYFLFWWVIVIFIKIKPHFAVKFTFLRKVCYVIFRAPVIWLWGATLTPQVCLCSSAADCLLFYCIHAWFCRVQKGQSLSWGERMRGFCTNLGKIQHKLLFLSEFLGYFNTFDIDIAAKYR